MDLEKGILINTYEKHKDQLESVLISGCINIPKHRESSKRARTEGNELFLKGNHDDLTHAQIFAHYSRSIALAPDASEELAQGYGNRSAFLLHIKKYNECIKDIDKALSITKSDIFKIKLLCRKAESMKALGLPAHKKILKTARSYLDELDGRDENRSCLMKLLRRAENSPFTEKESSTTDNSLELGSLKLSSNKSDRISDSVSIKYNKKYGRHLVAARDYLPGEIIFVEKLYATVLCPKKSFTNCYYCLKTSLNSIPCEHCSWAMFCSEECKNEAWKRFHDIECYVVPDVAVMCCDKKRHFHICLRALIVGIREAGTIEELKKELARVDKNIGFQDDGKFKSNTFKSLYSLKSGGTSGNLLEPMALSAFLILISLAKNTLIFGENFKLEKVKDLIENEDTLFVGSLLVKLREMKRMNAHSYSHYNNECGKLADSFECQKVLCCATGTSIAPLTSTINHSCFPNVAKCFTTDQNIIVYSVRPIKENYQLFDNYYSAFYDMPKVSRQKRMNAYDFICGCVACSEDWPPMLRVTSEMKEIYGSIPMEKMESNFYKDCEKIFLSLACGKDDFDKKTLEKLCKTMAKVMKQLRQPCYTTCLLMSAIPQVFSSIYGLRPQSFGDCI